MTIPRFAFLVVSSLLVLVAGCGSGGHGGSAPTTPAPHPASTASSAAVSRFCDHLQDVTDATGAVGVDTRLAAVKRDFPRLVQASGALSALGAPAGSGLGGAVANLAGDAAAVDAWIRTQATQSDLDGNHEPAAVRARFTRLRSSVSALEQWSTHNCQTGGDG